jgi:hypothetical protein
MADKNVLILRIMTHVVPECYYERMIDHTCKGIDEVENYHNFLAWNKLCLEELSFDEVNWVWGLCQRINNSKISMMDMECCSIWEADTIFYDQNKNLVLVHPR